MLGNSLALTPGNPVLRAGAATPYVQKYVAFDGTDYLELGTNGSATPIFTGQAALSELSFCMWVNMTTAVTASVYHMWFAQLPAGSACLQLNKSSTAVNSNRFRVRGFDSGGSQVFGVDSTTSVTAATGLKCLLFSGISGGACQFYWGDTDESNVLVPWAAGDVGFDAVDCFRFAHFTTGVNFIGECGGFALYPTRYDFSVQANRRLFIDGSGNPVSPPSRAIVKFGFEQGADALNGNAAQGWNDGYNQGSGGGTFTMTGAVTDV
jgi:hypothetical protein